MDVRWSVLEKDHEVQELLIIINDMSEFKALEANSLKNQEEMKKMTKIMDLGNQASIVLYGLKDLVEDSVDRINQFAGQVESVTALSRNVHTIKGNARSASFNTISDAAHDFESLMDEQKSNLSSSLLTESFESITHEFEKHWDAAKKLGKIGGRNVIEVEISKIDQIISELKGQNFSRLHVQILLAQIAGYPIEGVVADLRAKSGELSQRIGKPQPDFDIDSGSVFFRAKYLNLLKDAFGHLVRNSLDHGVEMPDQRLKAGKPSQGKITIKIEVSAPWVYIVYKDDGQGIDLEKVKARGIEKNLIDRDVSDPRTIADLIFAKNLSTKNEVTLLSGRGIGMDAVQAIIKNDLGGDIYLDHHERNGKFLRFSIRLKLPLETIY